MGNRVPEPARYLTITQAAAWLHRHYGMPAEPHALRHAVEHGHIVPYRLHDRGWCYFTTRRLARYAERLGFERAQDEERGPEGDPVV